MSCDNTQPTNNYSNCIVDTVKFINRLQKAVQPTEISCTPCKSPVLGETSRANTRPFILYLPTGEPFELACLFDTDSTSIPVFRVEEMNGNCCTLRVLIPVCPRSNTEDRGSHGHFVATRTCCTVDLTSFIGIQCLEDEYIPLDPCDY
ncbi:MAG: CotY/CotZ family spore coat protein [Turicibacter sp.]